MDFLTGLLNACAHNVQKISDDGSERSLIARILDPAGLLIESVNLDSHVNFEKFGDDEESCWLNELKLEAVKELRQDQFMNASEQIHDNSDALIRHNSSTSSIASDLA
uniref:Uncharacterized protein n=1 Tax=Timspurckia oligopyrenoides TaxID=708627 RepID=A0A7S0ZKP6_9RHOD|mmetsp:Transcript_9083/g.16349  ORF Transcript_9083/g.16349 Transcript_9083/m.16349 type:complete len:108 (+) Transcript_9083:62-385(+)|eukprot:CAMPEP_0182441174 /NCGR_PEP_ID=MMETSP1172-20130603/127_1 /TAXON_ID=708627 /ORGANISM="Timspurckia oligopyrenoides, Strain CCMP3278" /LENGTH=107 /DNA_ID=CAMNT_0024635337 /DNA_START=59 /DNA_END=382 /DNA_ORIENTATION=+